MLQTLSARSFMVDRVLTLRNDESVSDAIRQLGSYRFSGAPVAERNGTYVGVFSEKCCLKILSLIVLPDARVRADEIMQRDVVTLQPRDLTMGAITRLLGSKISGAPVLDEDEMFLGVFSE